MLLLFLVLLLFMLLLFCSAEEVKELPFFAALSWDDVLDKKVKTLKKGEWSYVHVIYVLA